MKKRRIVIVMLCCIMLLCSCGKTTSYILNEQTFFLVMTNMQYYPEQYNGADIEYDCFTYKLTDINGKEYICGIRKCSSGFGCTCGKDTIIGFLLEYDGIIPEPRNQSEDSNEKTWVHIKGRLVSSEKKTIQIYAYNGDEIDYNTIENILFLSMNVESIELIDDYSNLKYYVTK